MGRLYGWINAYLRSLEGLRSQIHEPPLAAADCSLIGRQVGLQFVLLPNDGPHVVCVNEGAQERHQLLQLAVALVHEPRLDRDAVVQLGGKWYRMRIEDRVTI